MKRYQYYDISPPVSEHLGVFPGDVRFQRHVSLETKMGHNITLSNITTTLHIGAHTDAPVHYHARGVAMHEVDVSVYFGPCQVVRVDIKRGERILPQHVKQELTAPRVLFHTGSFPNPNEWNSDFCALSPELIEFLASRGVVLVGIDTPSVDPQQSTVLESHQALFQTGVLPLEGIVLAHVPEGRYTLVAVPLALQNADASPVRALLIPENECVK